MTDDGESHDERSVATRFSRRRLLALTSVGLTGAIAGCSGGGSGGTDTPADTPADTATSTPTDGEPTSESTPTGTAEATATATPADIEVPEGGSYFAPDDGFADPAPWLEEEDPDIYRVTEPTREALADAVHNPGPRIVVFETSGTIDLQEGTLQVSQDKLFLAGQTAPSPGVTLVRGDLRVEANDCVVQHIRVRPGDAGNESDWQPDTLRTGDETSNNVVDHCTATWSVDENMTPGYDSVDTTFSNCLVAEALNEASHAKGPHAYGLLVGDGATGVALLGNVFAHNVARNPRLKAETESVVVNNVMYHFNEAVNLDPSTLSSIVGNAFLRADEDDANIEGGKAFVEGNYTDGGASMTRNTEVYEGRPVWPADLTAMDSDGVEENNFTYVGARPADRTEHDQRVVDAIRNNEGDYVDSQEDVGGYPDLDENTHSLDVPDAGLRDWLEAWAVAVEEPGVSPP